MEPGKQFVKMKPSALLPYALDRSDKYAQANVNVLADSINRRGYRASQHDNPHRNSDSHIHLWLTDSYPHAELINGNHRVHAMNQAGYDKAVPVRVTDERTDPSGPLPARRGWKP